MARKYELSFAGITIPLATPELEERLDRIHPQDTFLDSDPWNFEGNDLQKLPTPTYPELPPFRIGVLRWPTGACRPAWLHLVINTTRLNQIRDAIKTSGGVCDPMVPRTLKMTDGRPDKGIEAQMYLLPPRPLNQLGVDISDGWLLTLTDQRFWWNWRRGTITTTPASWDSLIAQLGAMLGITIDVDTVDPAYGVPSEKWIGYYRPTATVLDSALNQIGQRLVVSLDGSVKTVKWSTAKGLSDVYLEASNHIISGGHFDWEDIGRYVPYSVGVLFGDTSSTTAPHVETKYLGSIGLSSIYGCASGLPDTSANVFADSTYDGSNGTAISAMASIVAYDWYGWRAATPDLVFPGIEPWAPTGWEDYTEWTYQSREGTPFASTMVRRGPFDDYMSGGLPTVTAADDTEFWAQITAKCYYDGSDTRDADGFTPTGDGLNCPPDLLCLGRFKIYSWLRVTPYIPIDDDGKECPLSYTETVPAQYGSPQCFPLYHVNDVDMPCFPPASPRTQSPTIAANDPAAGDVEWTQPSLALAQDGAYASCALLDTEETQYLVLTGFCFGLAGNATITNINVLVNGHADVTGIPDTEVKLVVDGTITGTNKSANTNLPTSDAVRSYSFSPTNWGVPGLTLLQLNNSGFGVSLRYVNNSGDDGNVFIDDVQIAVSFTPAGFTAPRHSIVRIRRGPGNYYLFDALPWVDLFYRTSTEDADGFISFLRYFDQNAGDWRNGEEVRVILAE